MQSSPSSLPPRVSSSWRIGIVHSSYYPEEVGALVREAERVLREAGIARGNVRVFPVAGSFEIPMMGAALLEEEEVDALIGLGIIVRGETHHADLIAEAVSRGIMEIQVRHGVPFAFEVLYVDDLAQAQERCRGAGNRGGEAARAVLHSLAQLATIRS
jgi:6,7-dimethyl-8-ribityllumazine synthase